MRAGMERAARTSALVALVVAAAGCGYAPNFESGTLHCSSSHTCPQGYTCATDNTCWKNGATLPGATDMFIGHWVYDATSRLQQTCTDGTNTPSTLAGDYVDINSGTDSELLATYFCNWKLDLAATDKTTTTIVAGQTCMTHDATGTISFTLHGQSFKFTTTDGATATLSAVFPAEFKKVIGTMGTCQFTVTGRLVYTP
jgi:hypothetical protein